MTLEFRPCVPADADQAVPLIHSSGPLAYDYVFCDASSAQSMAFLTRAFGGTRTEFSHRQHWAGVLDGQVVACGGLRFAHQNLRFTVSAAASILRFYSPVAAGRTLIRGLRTEAVIPPPSGGAGFLYNLGVSPQWQGQGIGQQLIAFLLAELRQRGHTEAGLDVAETNTGARKLYERLGFREVTSRKGGLSSAFGRVVDHTHMTLDIAPAAQ